ncbi:hypothetical protein Ancab_016260 [Ancistrocladus abbreviatus]
MSPEGHTSAAPSTLFPSTTDCFSSLNLDNVLLDTPLEIQSGTTLLLHVPMMQLSPPFPIRSAILLDVISISALIIYVTRVALGYKQTRDRYQLLVNRTLYEKTIASGFGSIHFLLDASQQQQYKECILAYAILLNVENGQITCQSTLGEECERFLYDVFEEKVEMPVNKAVDTLKKFGLVTEETINGKSSLQVVPCSTAYNALKKHWDRLLS